MAIPQLYWYFVSVSQISILGIFLLYYLNFLKPADTVNYSGFSFFVYILAAPESKPQFCIFILFDTKQCSKSKNKNKNKKKYCKIILDF